MKVAVITTSRADYGIYHSLLAELAQAADVEYGLVVSGTHLSPNHGMTVTAIERDGHPIWGRVPSVPATDDAAAIATATGTTLAGFAAVWEALSDALDLVVCLGDRYEMFAAVAATVPFNLPVAHLHGGETTLGAIDDKYRHAITAMSTLHFTATEEYADRVAGITGSRDTVFAVGAPGLDGLGELKLPSVEDMKTRFGIDFSVPTVLVTVHPETVNLRANAALKNTSVAALRELAETYQIVITLPNADTLGQDLRDAFLRLAAAKANIVAIESFGKLGYFAAMRDCVFLFGNTSSGLIEAPSFGKYVINIGDRQKGRARSANVLDVAADLEEVRRAVRQLDQGGLTYRGGNVYLYDGQAARAIMKQLQLWQKGAAAGA